MRSAGWLVPVLAPACLLSLEGVEAQEVARRDSAGVEIVENRAAQWQDAGGWRIGAQPMVSIGVLDGAEAYQLHSVRAVERLADGRILVVNGGSDEVRLFAADGRFVRSFGGSGDGPGEFRDIVGLAVDGDTLIVHDRRHRRLSRFDLDGSVLHDTRLAETGIPAYGVDSYRMLGAIDDGRLIFTPYAFDAPPRPTPVQFWDSSANLAYSTDGVLLGPFGGASGMDMFGEPRLGTQLRLGAYSTSDVTPGRFVLTHGHAYELRVYGADGRLERIVRRERDPAAVDEAILDERLEAMLEASGSEQDRVRLRQMFEEDVARGRIAATLPAYQGIIVSSEGDVWARHYRPRWRTDPERWDVFDPSGRLLGTVTAPAGLSLHGVGSDHVVAVARDALDVEYVRVHPLIGSG